MNPVWLEAPSVRPEPVEGFAVDKKTRYLKLRHEFHEYLKQAKFDERDGVHSYSILLACYFADVMEGFYVISKDEAPLVQVPAILLRSMFEALVKLGYLANATATRNQVPSELLRRKDSLLYLDFLARRNIDKELESCIPTGQDLLPAGFNYDEAIKNLSDGYKKIKIEDMVKVIDQSKRGSVKSYLTYRFLSKHAHPMFEGMKSFEDINTKKISVFNRTEADMNMWVQCAANFTEGALFALKQLITPVRPELVEGSRSEKASTGSARTEFNCSEGSNANPSTSSGRTGVV